MRMSNVVIFDQKSYFNKENKTQSTYMHMIEPIAQAIGSLKNHNPAKNVIDMLMSSENRLNDFSPIKSGWSPQVSFSGVCSNFSRSSVKNRLEGCLPVVAGV